jgi:predicted acylesterase/phospholipase RssA
MEKPSRFHNLPLPVRVPPPIAERITHLRVAQALGVFLRSVDIGQRMITELRLKVDEPDVIIRPVVDEIGLLDKVDIHKVIQSGEQATVSALNDLRRSVSWTSWIRRQFFFTGYTFSNIKYRSSSRKMVLRG